MKKSILVLILTFLMVGLVPAQKKGLSKEQRAGFEKEIELMVRYLEETLTFIGDSTATPREKDIVFTQSYAKIFKDDKVQIEDDLDETRGTSINKDVQAYLKDIDFFFEYANFKFDIQNISEQTSESGATFFKVKLNRNLVGRTITADSVNNNKTRYIEINIDAKTNDLKIASIYTNKLNEKEELRYWWNQMPQSWKSVFAAQELIYDSIPIDSIYSIGDKGFFAAVPVVRVMGGDTVILWKQKDIEVDLAPLYDRLKRFTQIQSVDIANNTAITTLDPLSELSNLTWLNIEGSSITDLLPLRNANKLKTLIANRIAIDDISALKYDTQITELEIANTLVCDISILEYLDKLERLNLSNTLVKDLSPIREITALHSLVVSYSKIQSIEAVEGLINLVQLDVEGTNISDLSPLTSLVALQSLNIGRTGVTTLGTLAKLKSLREINLSNTKVGDITALSQHEHISRIYCDNTNVGVEEASNFFKTNPRTFVIYETEALSQWWNKLPIYWKALLSKQLDLTNEPNTEQLHQIINIKELDLSGNVYLQNLIPVSRLTNLESLDISNTEIVSLAPLMGMPNLRRLNMENTYVEQLGPLSNVVSLNYLSISNTNVRQIDTLAAISQLSIVMAEGLNIAQEQVIELKRNIPHVTVVYQTAQLTEWWQNLEQNWKDVLKQEVPLAQVNPSGLELQRMVDITELEIDPSMAVHSLEPLSRFIWLEVLSVDNQNIRDLSPLSDKVHMKELYLSNNPITDLSPLATNQSMEILNVENSHVMDLAPLSKMAHLRVLNVSGTAVKSLKPLAELQMLEELSAFNTAIKSISAIESIASLKQLKIYNTKVKQKSVDKLQQKRFDINIMYY